MLKLWQTDRNQMLSALGLTTTQIHTAPEYRAELEDALANFWIPQTAANPGRHLWYTNWEIILKSTNTSVGGIGFAGFPNEAGEAETGFMLDNRHHGNGYALEALQEITGWAFDEPCTKRVVAQTYAANLPAQRLLTNAGFVLLNVENDLMKFSLTR